MPKQQAFHSINQNYLRMKKFLLFSVLLSFIFFSCKKEDPPVVYYSYGQLTSVDGVAKIVTDKNNTLTVKNSLLSSYDNKRVYVEYNILKNAEPNFDIELYWIDSILTKNIIDTAGLTQTEQDSIGNANIYNISAQFSGKYLMTKFAYTRYDYTTRHFVNAVGFKSKTGDTVHITLRHNDYTANNNAPYYRTYSRGFINLEIDSWVPSGRNQVEVFLYDSKDGKSVFFGNGIYKRSYTAPLTFSASKEDLGSY